MSYQGDVRTTVEKAGLYEVIRPLLQGMYSEFKEFSKKKPEAVLSESKIRVVNRLLEACREVLCAEPTLKFLDLLDEDVVPQNSDVVLMLSQYEAAMSKFRFIYYSHASGWATE